MKRFAKLVNEIAPFLLDHPLSGIRMCDDDELKFEACTRWGKKEFVFTVNLAYHNIHDWAANKALIIHEFAHFREQSNAHLLAGFWRASEIIGSKLTLLAESNPGLFRGTGSAFKPERYKRFVDPEMLDDAQAAAARAAEELPQALNTEPFQAEVRS